MNSPELDPHSVELSRSPRAFLRKVFADADALSLLTKERLDALLDERDRPTVVWRVFNQLIAQFGGVDTRALVALLCAYADLGLARYGRFVGKAWNEDIPRYADRILLSLPASSQVAPAPERSPANGMAETRTADDGDPALRIAMVNAAFAVAGVTLDETFRRHVFGPDGAESEFLALVGDFSSEKIDLLPIDEQAYYLVSLLLSAVNDGILRDGRLRLSDYPREFPARVEAFFETLRSPPVRH